MVMFTERITHGGDTSDAPVLSWWKTITIAGTNLYLNLHKELADC